MSAEGKKKRGVGGASNARNQPFRLGGGGVHPDHYARMMRSVGGQAEKIGRPRPGSAWDKRTDKHAGPAKARNPQKKG